MAQNAQGEAQEEPAGEFGSISRMLWPFIMFFFLSSFLNKNKEKPPPSGEVQQQQKDPNYITYAPLFQKGEPLEFFVFVKQEERWRKTDFDELTPVWQQEIIFDSTVNSESYTRNFSYVVDDFLLNDNGTLWMHFFVSKRGFSINPNMPLFDKTSCVHKSHPLIKYAARKVDLHVSNACTPNDCANLNCGCALPL